MFLIGSQTWSGCSAEEEISWPCHKSNLDSVAIQPVTILMELFWNDIDKSKLHSQNNWNGLNLYNAYYHTFKNLLPSQQYEKM
jgi:hypothetical protein